MTSVKQCSSKLLQWDWAHYYMCVKFCAVCWAETSMFGRNACLSGQRIKENPGFEGKLAGLLFVRPEKYSGCSVDISVAMGQVSLREYPLSQFCFCRFANLSCIFCLSKASTGHRSRRCSRGSKKQNWNLWAANWWNIQCALSPVHKHRNVLLFVTSAASGKSSFDLRFQLQYWNNTAGFLAHNLFRWLR